MSGFLAVSLFALGCVVGAIAHKLFTSNAGTASRLSNDLDSVSQEFADYQDKVDAHFRETADLVQTLTQNYAAVHQKLSDGAQKLSRSSITPLTAAADSAQKTLETSDEEESLPSAPIDYPERES